MISQLDRQFRSSPLFAYWRGDRAAQIVEFAVALPLLVVFVVGIFDFSNAFTLKQKLTNIARDAARSAAADPSSDLGSSMPASVADAYYLIDNYLIANNLNDCGITLPPSGSSLVWTATGTGNGCPAAGLKIIINRGYSFPANVATQTADPTCGPQVSSPTQINVIATCVSIQYPYQWRFGSVASLLGRNMILPTTISAASVAMNQQ